MLDAQGWSQLAELFHRATELPEDAQEAFAIAQTQGAPALREELLAMLAADRALQRPTHTPLQRAADALLRGAEPDLPAGTRFGPWAVQHKLGSGGMGSVYLANRADGAYEREVALKLVPLPAAALDSSRHTYFQYECRLLARMQHPAIAHIHDAGIEATGHGYLVMEYINGTTLTRWCDEHRANLRARVQLLLQVAEGVQHAHQKGVIHRDLKPSNVLVEVVDGQPLPRIIDFGIATAFDAGDDQPVSGIGTPGYMSPEQGAREADVDARADVYSLGALLYELVCGLDPAGAGLALADWQALLPARQRELAGKRDATAVQVRNALRNGLSAVIAKAMAVERKDRYDAVSGLIEDLRLWMEHRVPQAAGRPRGLLLRRFIGRNRLAMAAAAVTAVAVVGGFAGTVWALQQAQEQAGRAKLSADFLASILDSVDPAMAQDMDKTLMLHVLDDASRRASTELARYPDTQADIELIIAINLNSLEEPARAQPHLETVLELSKAHPRMLKLQRLRALQVMGDNLLALDQVERGAQVLKEGIAEAQASVPEHQWLALDMQSRLAWLELMRGNGEEAQRLALTSMEGLEALRGRDDQQRLDAVKRYAGILATVGEHDEARKLLDEVIDRRTELNGAEHPLTVSARLDRAVAMLQNKQYAAAEPELRAIVALYQERYGEQSGHAAVVIGYLGSALRNQGHIAEAGPYYRQTMEWHQTRYGPESFSSVVSRHNHANWLLAAGQARQAVNEQRATLEIARRAIGDHTHVTAEILRNLAEAESALGLHESALSNARQALQVMRAVYGDDHPGALNDARETLAKVEAAEGSLPVSGPAVP